MKKKAKKKLRPTTAVESKRDKIAKWLSIIVAITVIISFVFEFPQKLFKSISPESSRFYGIVKDEKGKPVTNAEIDVREKEGDKFRLGFGKTSSNGEFNISVKANPKATIWVTVTKNGEVGFKGYKNFLEHDPILFKNRE